jgi:ribosomal-protein-alanine N-acetyltransferase
MLQFNFSPFPILVSDRLLLRETHLSDVDKMFEMRSNHSLMKHLARPIAETKEDALLVINKTIENCNNNIGINWVITLKGNDELIGTIGFYRTKPEHHRAEVGYMLLEKFHRKGIMLEAMNAVLDYGFNTMHLHSVEAVTDPENIASQELLLKCKFRKEGHFIQNEYFDAGQRFIDSAVYSKLKDW